jgi:hypothetical protein
MIKKLFFLLLILISINGIYAVDQSVSINYDSNNDLYYEELIDFSSVLLKINTEFDSFCKYSISPGNNYLDLESNFDLSAGKLHEKSFSNLGDGIYRYYIKCSNNSLIEPPQLTVSLRVNSLVTGAIILSEEDPLNEGKVEVTLTTSKIVSGTPNLEYSFDSIVYNDLPLFGSDKNWRGYLVIPKEVGESSLSFKFLANDLEGRQGNQLTSGSVFFVDTDKPGIVYDIEAIGYDGEIRLEWIYNEDYEEFNIYKSTSPNPEYIDFFKSVDKLSYEDKLVEKGKTYYYRISAVDEAGNEGSLSEEIYAVALLNDKVSETELSLELIGFVDGILLEIEDLKNQANEIKDDLLDSSEKELDLIEKMGLNKELENLISEIGALEKEVERYKLQDLSESELNKKLDSAEVKIEIIRNSLPEKLEILKEDSIEEEITKLDLETIILTTNSEVTKREKEKILDQSFKSIQDSNLNIRSFFYDVRVSYLNGDNNEFSIVDKKISAELERGENRNFIEIISKQLISNLGEVSFVNSNNEEIGDNLVSFQTDIKSLTYYFNEKKSFDLMKESKLIFLEVEESEEKIDNSLTGYSILNSDYKSYFGLSLGLLFLFFIGGYLFYMRKNNPSEPELKIFERIKKGKKLIEDNKLNDSFGIYNSINIEYKQLNKKSKSKVYPKIINYHNKLLIQKIKNNLELIKNKNNLNVLNEIEKDYERLPEKHKKKIKPLINKIKGELK